VARTFLTPGDACADETQPLCAQVPGAAGGVLVVGIPAVDDHVARFEQWQKGLDEVIHDPAGLDHQHHLAGPFQGSNQLLEAVAADDRHSPRRAFEEIVDTVGGAVEYRHAKAVVCHVQDQVLAHYRESDQADICSRHALPLVNPRITPIRCVLRSAMPFICTLRRKQPPVRPRKVRRA
jgi:hypothetical protein